MNERLVLWHRWMPPRRDEPSAHPAVAAWQRSVATRFSVAGGELLGAMGGTVIAAFELSDATDAIDMALDLLEEAEQEASLEVAIGAAAGVLEEHEGTIVGAPIERAQLLVNRAKAGELVLDAAARTLVADEFNFGRRVGAGAGAARGITVDRRHPRRAESAAAILSLRSTALPPVIDSVRADIEQSIAGGHCRTFVLRGPVGAGATELIRALERALAPPQVFTLGASPGGVVPLASLRLALLRQFGEPARVAEAMSAPAGALLARVAAGELVPARELAHVFAALARRDEPRPWVVLNPLGLVDGATLAALLEAREFGADFVLFGRYPVELALPRPLAELTEPVMDLILPPLKTADARVVAEAILGPDTSDEVARQVAVLGGDTVLGVVEAARTLITAGDLVLEDGRFTFRMGARRRPSPIDSEKHLGERLERLDPNARRVLEAIAVMPDGSPLALLEAIAARDGIGESALSNSLARLEREALAHGRDHPRPASSLLRWRILNLIPPARYMELHRYFGEALAVHHPNTPALEAELGYFLFEGGLEDHARPLLTRAMEALIESGYERAARQLAGWLEQREGEDDDAGARITPPPPEPDHFEKSPPSTEIPLDEDLHAASQATSSPTLPPPPPRRPLTASSPPVLGGSADPEPNIEASIDDALAELRIDELESGDRSLSGLFDIGEPPPPVDEGSLPIDLERLLAGDDDATSFELERLLRLGRAPKSPGLDPKLEAHLPKSHPFGAFDDERTSISPAPLSPFVAQALLAIRTRDRDALERAMERAIAEGIHPGTLARVRALAELARGDLDAARRSLQEARIRGRDDRAAQARAHLAEAIVELHGGDPVRGIRAGLAALAASRRDGDARGEAAALRTLAACYRALGRDDQARLIEAR